MKLKELLDELNKSTCYNNFIKDNKCFLCAVFCVPEENKYNLDFFIPDKKKIACFEYPFDNFKIYEEKIDEAKEIDICMKIDIGDIKAEADKIKNEQKVNMNISKTIAILKDNLWNLTCMDNSLGMLRIKINASSGEVIEFKKGSLMDLMIRK